ncbi:MAG: LysM peptidoglycan-binding domain-containing protein [Ardenticatenaceae bacterium]|nr:LysM peptidoglycan-binding domain-containing protein [Anaerolineales bacterium]MCB8939019.1 LysM peptidoglycan-binding domain-containing protein [Ardenticatenaceae bacterium]MCB8974775.1 LysM peptidoglycan-binding domain-containing protein [Ardenticatenaceae bacterium]
MKNKIAKSVLLLAATLFVALFGLPQSDAAAQDIISGNLFENGGFEAGYFNQDDIPQIAVPNGWRMHWLDGVAFEGTEGRVAYRPETVVWNIQDAPESERSLFFKDGSYTLKLFKPWAPLFVALSQEVSGLEVGRNYRIVAPIYVDIVESYEGGKQPPGARPDAGFIRFSVGPAGSGWRTADLTYSPTWGAANVGGFYLNSINYIWDFTATSESMIIFLEMGSKVPYVNSGFFMDGVGLYALGTTGEVPSSSSGGGTTAQAGPTATPFPTPTPRPDGAIIHVVNTGDTFWTIAIRYAPALGVTPEEALPLIRELNNNPAFIAVGQELIIKEPGAVVPTAEPTAEPPAEEADAAPTEEVIEVEGTDSGSAPADAAPAEEVAEVAAPTTGTICVAAFDDQNADGVRDDATEGLQADAAITIFRGGSTVTTHITDGASEPYCFENLAPDTYQVQIFPPADYQPTTSPSWAVSVAEGAQISVAFGTRFDPQETAVTDTTTTDTTTDTTAVDSETADTTETAPAEEGGFFSSIGGIVLVVAAILVLLAGVGVVMLRRG